MASTRSYSTEIPTKQLDNMLTRLMFADHMIQGLIRKGCPTQHGDCFWCEARLRTESLGMRAGSHFDDCPWLYVIKYASSLHQGVS